MKKKLLILLLLIFSFFSSYAQQLNLRKLVMKSDVIFLSKQQDCIRTIHYRNDYTIESFYKIISIDRVLKNKTNFKKDRDQIKHSVENEDYFSASSISDNECALPVIIPDDQKKGMLFFLKKVDKEYITLAILSDSLRNNFLNDINQVIAVSELEKITNLKDRFIKTLDWFIENNVYPTEDFISFYKQKNIIKDSLVLSDALLEKAKQNFLMGKENLLPFVKEKYKSEIKKYFVDKLTAIRHKYELEFGDYWEFDKTITKIKNNFNDDYYNVDRIINDLLTSDEVSKDDKRAIMDYFIQMIQKE